MEQKEGGPARQVIVMDGNPLHDWCAMFSGCTLSDGSPLRIIQAAWNKVSVTVYDGKGLSFAFPTPLLVVQMQSLHTFCSPHEVGTYQGERG